MKLTLAERLFGRCRLGALVVLASSACGSDVFDTDPGVTARDPGTGSTGPGQAGSQGSGGPGFSLGNPPPASSGKPMDEPSADGKNCGVTTHALERLPPEVLVVLDRSGSMVENKAAGPACATRACGTRWDEVKGALSAALGRTETQIRWGLKLYPDDDLCGVGPGVQVAVGDMNAAAINAAVNVRPPLAGKTHTPTREAVRAGAAYLRARTTPNPKYLLLATDGEPNCLSAEKTGSQDRMAAIQAVAESAAGGIPVYVVGVATLGSRAHETLNLMAQGGGRARDAAEAGYYAVGTSEELTASLAAIGAQVTACTFVLQMPPPVRDNVVVKVDDARVPHDPGKTNPEGGWDYGPDGHSIQLHGAWCDRAQKSARTVQALFGCPGIVIQ